MGLVKRLLTFVLVGLLLGGVVASFIAPGIVSWYQQPGTGRAMCDCAELARSTTDSLLNWQMIGAVIGGVAFLILGIIFSLRRRGGRGRGETESKAGEPPAIPPRTSTTSGPPPSMIPPA